MNAAGLTIKDSARKIRVEFPGDLKYKVTEQIDQFVQLDQKKDGVIRPNDFEDEAKQILALASIEPLTKLWNSSGFSNASLKKMTQIIFMKAAVAKIYHPYNPEQRRGFKQFVELYPRMRALTKLATHLDEHNQATDDSEIKLDSSKWNDLEKFGKDVYNPTFWEERGNLRLEVREMLFMFSAQHLYVKKESLFYNENYMPTDIRAPLKKTATNFMSKASWLASKGEIKCEGSACDKIEIDEVDLEPFHKSSWNQVWDSLNTFSLHAQKGKPDGAALVAPNSGPVFSNYAKKLMTQ